MNCKSRLEIYVGKDVKSRTVIAGERQALRELANALLKAADVTTGFHSINVYKGNGHDYEIFVTKNVEEDEWQNMPSKAEGLEFIKDYDQMLSTMK